jgi:tetratricopeptide (TPR) repeat protein
VVAVKPQPLAVPAPVVFTVRPPPPTARSLDAQQFNLLGRQLTKAGRYREAVVELTQALRIAPDFAMAFNARAFALLMLHEWARAIEDLDRAILLNPSYGDAYKTRAIARKAVGDARGAAADFKTSQRLLH